MVDEFVDKYSRSKTKKERRCSGDVHVLGVRLVRISRVRRNLFAVVCSPPDVMNFPVQEAILILFCFRGISNSRLDVSQSWRLEVGEHKEKKKDTLSRSKPREMNMSHYVVGGFTIGSSPWRKRVLYSSDFTQKFIYAHILSGKRTGIRVCKRSGLRNSEYKIIGRNTPA